MTESAKRIPRRRGGQPGNQNAYKHGRSTARAKGERAWVRWLIRQSWAHIKSDSGADGVSDRPGADALVTAWRDQAALLRRYAPAAANAWEDAADELEAHLRATEADLLTLQAAARETGYTADHLGRLIRAGKLENHGREHAPKVRRGDLPRKAARRANLALQPGGAHMGALTREAIASTRRRSA